MREGNLYQNLGTFVTAELIFEVISIFENINGILVRLLFAHTEHAKKGTEGTER